MKVFTISDVHGHYKEMITALNEVGFDENNKDHLLISVGDEFDRGQESLAVYEYLKRLSDKGKAIVLKGNHSKFLIEYLKGTSITPFNYFHNGTNETLADFLHETAPFETFCLFNHIDNPTYDDFANWITLARKEINKEYPELINWLETRPYYYETENYIFTHGAIDTDIEDWHESNWDKCIWDDGSFFGKTINNTNKTVVIGHFGTYHLRKMYHIKENKDIHSILKRDDGQVIAIDATTALSKKVNVFVVEDEVITSGR